MDGPKGWLDNSVEWLSNAVTNIKPSESEKDIKIAKNKFKSINELHDQWLDKKGQ